MRKTRENVKIRIFPPEVKTLDTRTQNAISAVEH